MEELWKDVVGYEGLYIVSNIGNIMSLGNGNSNSSTRKLLKQQTRVQTYLGVSFNKDGKRNVFQSHRIVALSFIPNPNNYSEINHINGIKFDNRVENLEWCSHSQNIQHAYDTKLLIPSRGDLQKLSKLTNENVVQIRELSNKGVSKNELADKFHVAKCTICRVVNRATWNNI